MCIVVGLQVRVSSQRLRRTQRAALVSSSRRRWATRIPQQQICVLRSNDGIQCPVESSSLIVDGTNVLSRVYGSILGGVSSSRSERVTRYRPRDVFLLWMEFLASYVGAGAVLCVFDHPANSRPAGGDDGLVYKEKQGYKMKRRRKLHAKNYKDRPHRSHLWEYQEYFKSKGADRDMIISPKGCEADAVIRNIVDACLQEDRKEDHRIYVASGDADLQECIDEHVSWVKILPFPTLACPNGLECITLEMFEWKDYFHPRQYGTFLTLVGKSESGIGGLGLSDKMAAKLIRVFGSVEEMSAAGASGQLKSWDARVQELFGGNNKRLEQKLKRNMRIFGPSLNSSVKIDFDHVRWMDAGMENTAHREIRAHPIISIHWDLIQGDAHELVKSVAGNTYDIVWQAQLSHGLRVDAALHIGNEILYLFFIPTSDTKYQCDSIQFSNAVADAFESMHKGSLRDPFKVQKSIQDRSLARYVGLLKKSNQNVLLIPVNAR